MSLTNRLACWIVVAEMYHVPPVQARLPGQFPEQNHTAKIQCVALAANNNVVLSGLPESSTQQCCGKLL